jgi:hypothetical protein
VYLREDVEQAGSPIEPRGRYLACIQDDPQPSPRLLSIAIAGLGECGTKSDAALAAGFVGHHNRWIAAAAVQAVQRLDGEGHSMWLAERVDDARVPVARQAARALFRSSMSVDVQAKLRSIVRSGMHPHSRRFALRALLYQHPYEGISDAIRAAASSDVVSAKLGAAYLDRALNRGASIGPNTKQLSAWRSALAEVESEIPEAAGLSARRLLRMQAGSFPLRWDDPTA